MSSVFKFAGQIRDYNIIKKKWVLCNDTVLYVSTPDIRKVFKYDLEQECHFDYSKMDQNGLVEHIAQFGSRLWQIHPFDKGNTRTTAVFTIFYLCSMDFDVTNDLFANHSWYFRNALVHTTYQNIQKGIIRNLEYNFYCYTQTYKCLCISAIVNKLTIVIYREYSLRILIS